MNARNAYIALNMMDKVGPVTVRNLVDELGCVEAIFTEKESAISALNGAGRAQISAILAQRDKIEWEMEIERVNSMGARIITQIDPEYPEQLKEIHDPPLAIYIVGRLEERDKNGIAVVGTRRPTHYGRETTSRLSRQLAGGGVTVMSGLAAGVDTVAHEAALAGSGRTVAVLGSAIDCVYPASNKPLARKIAGQGAVISEFPLGRHPDKTTFPMRNRIVSGLSMGVLVVEAGARSGSLITANQALEQGRSVFAVPGRIDSPLSAGSHSLIKTGAVLVESVDDIFKEYEFLLPERLNSASKARKANVKLSDNEQVIVELLTEGERNVDSLVRDSGLKTSIVSGLLVGLEMKRMVKMLPGGIVERRQDG